MLFYIENSKGKRAYADQETEAWDAIKGQIPDAVEATRAEKLVAVELALDAEKAKGTVDMKNLPKAVTDKQKEYADAIKAEVLATKVSVYDAVTKQQTFELLATPDFACSWDGRSSYVTTLAGTFPAAGIPIMGWPQTDVPPDPPVPPTQEQIDAAIAAAVARLALQDAWRAAAQAQMQLGIPAYQAWVAANPYPT